MARSLAVLVLIALLNNGGLPSVIAGEPVSIREATPKVFPRESLGLEPNTESLRKHLRSIIPTSGDLKNHEALILQLGANSYRQRESAMRELIELPLVSATLLNVARNGQNLEIRRRAERILKSTKRRSRLVLSPVYQVIRQHKLTGLAKEILETIPYCQDSNLVKAATLALRTTAIADDAEFLQQHFQATPQSVSLAAIQSYEHLLGPAADSELQRLCNTSDDRVKVEVARALANHGNRKSLGLLVSLLGSKSLSVRVQSAKVLRQFTGQAFEFTPYETAKIRATALGRWKTWVEQKSKRASLRFPLTNFNRDHGRILICDYSRHRLVEMDLTGKIVWETTVGRNPWGVQGLENGHRLVASYSGRSVVEFDETGKQIWSSTGLLGGPTSVRRLQNGNTLLACTDSQQVIEINHAGTIVWSVKISGRPTDAQRLSNGRTLVTLQNANRVVELDRKGSVVWSINQLASPFSARRLSNGNTIVSSLNGGAIREYNRAGTQIWFKKGYQSPYDVQRLENGNTLLSHRKGVSLIDPQGKLIKLYPFTNASKFYRY